MMGLNPEWQIAFLRLLQARDPLQIFAATRGDRGMLWDRGIRAVVSLYTKVPLDSHITRLD